MIKLIKSIWRDRELIFELSRRELFQGNAGHIFGRFWVFANPLLTLGIYFLVFRLIFPSRLPGSAATEVFLIAGLVQWIIMSEVLVKSAHLLRGHANLVKQINFPIETLFAKLVASAVFVQVVMTVGLVAIMIVTSGFLPVKAIGLWMIALFLQAIFMFGIAMLVGAITPFIPDISEIIGIIARLGLFVTPILYTYDQFGSLAATLFYANPFSYFAWIHQEALYDQALTNPVAWFGAAFLALAALWIGNRAFSILGPGFTDVL